MSRRAVWLLVGFLALETLFVRIAQLEDLREHVAAFLGLFGVAFLIYLAIAWGVQRSGVRTHQTDRRLLLGIALGAVVFRLTLLGLTPTLSDDIYRYLWDGRVQQAGLNPYRYTPDAPALAHLREETWHQINHKDIPTIYPPLMQAAFRLGAWLSPALLAQKLVFLTCDLVIVLLLLVWLPRWGISPLMGLIYAWHPLVVVEAAASGHNDPLGVLWLLIGLALWQRKRRAAGTVAFALAFLAKFTTLLLWPFYWVRARKLLLLFVAVVGLGGLSCLCSPHFTPGLGHYARHWEFNSSLYSLLLSVVGQPLAVRLLSGAILVIAGVVLARRTDDLVHYTLRMLQLAILLAPVLEPWYLLWLLPLLCLRPSWMWLVFSGLVMLSYTVLIRYVSEGLWQIPAWATWAEYGPLYVWMIVRAWRGYRSEIRGQKSEVRI